MSIPTLYGPEFSYFLRSVRLLFNYKGIEHRVSRAPYGKEIELFSDEHQALHPFKKIPVLIIGNAVLPETIAIAWHIENKPGPSIMPGDANQQAMMLSVASNINQYVHKAIMSNLILELVFPKGSDGEVRFDVINEHLSEAKAVLQWLVQQLNDRDYINGDQFSLADAYLIPMLDYLDQMPAPYNLIQEFERLQGYLEFHREQAYSKGILGKPE